MPQTEHHLVVHHAVYHQRAGHQPQGMNGKGTNRFIRFLRSGEPSLHVSDFHVGASWTPIPFGAIEMPGMMDVINHGGPPRDTLPTPEEELAMEGRILEISLVGDPHQPHLIVMPEESDSFTPARPTVFLRSRTGEPLRVSYSVYPR